MLTVVYVLSLVEEYISVIAIRNSYFFTVGWPWLLSGFIRI